jgi:hypothetical protein
MSHALLQLQLRLRESAPTHHQDLRFSILIYGVALKKIIRLTPLLLHPQSRSGDSGLGIVICDLYALYVCVA